ncbi:hypothetical protein ACRAWF_46475 [Streptomyces sp. L7]
MRVRVPVAAVLGGRPPHRLRPVRRPHRTARQEAPPSACTCTRLRPKQAALPLGFDRPPGPRPQNPVPRTPRPLGGPGPSHPGSWTSRAAPATRSSFLTYDHDAGARSDLGLRRHGPRTAPARHRVRHAPGTAPPRRGPALRRPAHRDLRHPDPAPPAPPTARTYTTTRRAAADCGISALVLRRASTTTGTLTYARGAHHLTPGDIVRDHPDRHDGPTAPGNPGAGLTVGRLEDYL